MFCTVVFIMCCASFRASMAQTKPLTAENEMREQVLKGVVKERAEKYMNYCQAPHTSSEDSPSAKLHPPPPHPRQSHLPIHRNLPPTDRLGFPSRPLSILWPFLCYPCLG